MSNYSNFGRSQEIDRIFRQSRLFREKWNRVDYRNATIDKALNTVVNSYKSNSLLEVSSPSIFRKRKRLVTTQILTKKALESLVKLIEEDKIPKISINKWRELAYLSGISSSANLDTRKKAFQRARKELCDLGYIEIDSHYCWLKRDTGQAGTNAGYVPFEEAGQTGHVSLDMCPDVPIG